MYECPTYGGQTILYFEGNIVDLIKYLIYFVSHDIHEK